MVGTSNAEAMRGEKPDLTWFAPEWSGWVASPK